MSIDTLKKTFMIALILAMAVVEELCEVGRYFLIGPTLTSDDSRDDSKPKPRQTPVRIGSKK